MSAPVVPQRPARSTNTAPASQSEMDTPKVPPRPNRHLDRSQSRERANFARSPLNESPFALNTRHGDPGSLDPSSATVPGLPRRNPSVASLPLIGQEGAEYASLDAPLQSQTVANDLGLPSGETRNVASDLPLHAPKASVAPAAARTGVATVTRTDSEKAAVMGVGKSQTEYDDAMHSPSHHTVKEARPPSAISTERPSSTQAHSLYESDHEIGIPSFGITVPMYPNAGDVQAPTPGPVYTSHPPSSAHSHDGSRPPTADGRRRSAQGFHVPPGSYGLHGHGVIHQDRFEKDWYKRHPEELAKEDHALHTPAMSTERPAWAMSSEDLNKLVHESGKRDIGMGTSHTAIGTPSEAIGYQASEEYSLKMVPPHTGHPPTQRARLSRPGSQSFAESPLRQAFSPGAKPHGFGADSETDDDKVHMKPITRRADKYTGGGYDPPTRDLGPGAGNTDEHGGWINELGVGTPILASDEIAKHPGAEYMLPAVSPSQQMSEDDYFSGVDSELHHAGTKSRSRSRPSSRPSSLHSHSGLSRFISHEQDRTGTPLEEIEEYEPLFDENDKDEPKKPLTAADRLKRPELERRRFPSQDIWEDTPNSLQLQTTVDHEQEPAVVAAPPPSSKAPGTFEHPDKEQSRKGEVLESERIDRLTDPTKSLAKPKFDSSVQYEMRPGLAQRFPSRDIWEDTPDSLRLETTVGDEIQQASPPLANGQAQPTVPARPVRTKAEAVSDQPSIPPRPQRLQETSPTERKGPLIPERPKPQIPQRPAKIVSDTADATPLTKTVSAGSDSSDSTPLAKTKPPVPARPQGSSKFASIKAGFMNDLNSRLQLGPKPPAKPQEKEESDEAEEKQPLADARKGRARGPARRKPASSPSGVSESVAEAPLTAHWGFTKPWAVWSVGHNGTHFVTAHATPYHEQISKPTTVTAEQLDEQVTASPLARNTAGEALQSASAAPGTTSGALAHPSSAEMDIRAHRESQEAQSAFHTHEEERIGHAGDVPDIVVDDNVVPVAAAAKAHVKDPLSGGESGGTMPEALEAIKSATAMHTNVPMETLLDDKQPGEAA